MAFVFSCPRCEFSCRQEPKFYDHLVQLHNVSPEEEFIRVKYSEGIPKCACGCGEDLRIPRHPWKNPITSTYLRGHNASVSSAFTDRSTIEKMKAKRDDSRRAGKWKVWNAGLTKENCESLQVASTKKSKTLREKYSTGKITPWQKGHKVQSSKGVRRMSETRRRLYLEGKLSSWNLGLASDTDDRVKEIGRKISESYTKRVAGRRLDPEEVRSRIESAGFEVVDDSEYRTRRVNRITVVHTVCGTTQAKSLAMIEETGHCVKCHQQSSQGQREIYEFIKTLDPDATEGRRDLISPLEIDIWSGIRKFGVEYNGLYWHSEKFRDSSYHGKKSRMVKEIGGSLLHVYSDEWETKRDIVKSMIRHRMGSVTRKIHARKCTIRQLDVTTRREFFESSHLSGDARATISWGLFLDEELVSAISLRRPFHRKWSDRVELARFASKIDTQVVGALGRLTRKALEHAKENGYSGIMTYVDAGIGDGHSYRSVGYKEVGAAPVSFWWTDGKKRYDRFMYRADKAQGLTQSQVAEGAGVFKIHGCGNLVMCYDSPT